MDLSGTTGLIMTPLCLGFFIWNLEMAIFSINSLALLWDRTQAGVWKCVKGKETKGFCYSFLSFHVGTQPISTVCLA